MEQAGQAPSAADGDCLGLDDVVLSTVLLVIAGLVAGVVVEDQLHSSTLHRSTSPDGVLSSPSVR